MRSVLEATVSVLADSRFSPRTAGHREFISMLPLVCNDAVAILFMFDLSRKATLTSIKEWYRQVRSINKVIAPRPVGRPSRG